MKIQKALIICVILLGSMLLVSCISSQRNVQDRDNLDGKTQSVDAHIHELKF